MNIIANNIMGPWTWGNNGYISIEDVLIMLSVVVFYLLLHRLVSKQPLKFPLQKHLELDQYTLAFEATHCNTKKLSALTRCIAYLMIILLIITPMSELMSDPNYHSIWELIF